LFAAHVPGVLQIKQNQLEKLFRNVFRSGDIVGQHMAAAVFLTEPDQRLERVLTLLGHHKIRAFVTCLLV
jgi:hypothetical protein